jgi:predicted Kef-type K+ transport protein
MSLDQTNIFVRVIEAVGLFFLINVLIDSLISDEQSNRLFKLALLFACLLFIFVGGVLFK